MIGFRTEIDPAARRIGVADHLLIFHLADGAEDDRNPVGILVRQEAVDHIDVRHHAPHSRFGVWSGNIGRRNLMVEAAAQRGAARDQRNRFEIGRGAEPERGALDAHDNVAAQMRHHVADPGRTELLRADAERLERQPRRLDRAVGEDHRAARSDRQLLPHSGNAHIDRRDAGARGVEPVYLAARYQKKAASGIATAAVRADIVAHRVHDERCAAEFVEGEQAGARCRADHRQRRLAGLRYPGQR